MKSNDPLGRQGTSSFLRRRGKKVSQLMSQECTNECLQDADEDDEDLKSYYKECRAASGNSDGETGSDGGLDVSTPSAWRASANSPLRGQAGKRSASQGTRLSLTMAPPAPRPLTLTSSGYKHISKRLTVSTASGPVFFGTAAACSATAAQTAPEWAGLDIVLDCFCCVRQSPSRYFSLTAEGTSWELNARGAARLKEVGAGDTPSLCGSVETPLRCFVEASLKAARVVLAVELGMEAMDPSRLIAPGDVAGMVAPVTDAAAFYSASRADNANFAPGSDRDPLSSVGALRRASFLCLSSLKLGMDEVMTAYKDELMSLQEKLEVQSKRPTLQPHGDAAGCVPITTVRQERIAPCATALDIAAYTRDLSQLSTPIGSLLSILDGSQITKLPLSQHHNHSRVTPMASPHSHSSIGMTPSEHGLNGAKTVEAVCAKVMDFLTLQVGKHQKHCNVAQPMNEKAQQHLSLSTALLLAGAWPWIEVFTLITGGVVPKIDEGHWHDRIPKLFKHSYPSLSPLVRRTGKSALGDSVLTLVSGCEGIARHRPWRHTSTFTQTILHRIMGDVKRFVVSERGAATNCSPADYNKQRVEVVGHTETAAVQNALQLGAALSPEQDANKALMEIIAWQDESVRLSAANDYRLGEQVFQASKIPLVVFDGARTTVALVCNDGNRLPLVKFKRSAKLHDSDAEDEFIVRLDVSIPAAEWVCRALLKPVADAVHWTQRYFLNELFRQPLSIEPLTKGKKLSSSSRDSHDLDEAGLEQHYLASTLMTKAATRITFVESLHAIEDIALFKNWDVFMNGFVSRLAGLPPMWWLSSPATLVSTFLDFTHNPIRSEEQTSECPVTYHDVVEMKVVEGLPSPSLSPSIQLLHLLHSMRLVWNLPEQHAVVLTPHVFYHNTCDDWGADSYSRMFCFLTSLLLAQRLLTVHWKENKWEQCRRRGSSFTATTMQLKFVMDCLIRFVLEEGHAAMRQLSERFNSNGSSVSEVCKFVDDFIAHLDIISLQTKEVPAATGIDPRSNGGFDQPPSLNARGRASSSKTVMQSIVLLLRLVYDVCLMPQSANDDHGGNDITNVSKVRLYVSQLVSALDEIPEGGALFKRTRSLRTQLTFNGYFQ